MPIKTKQIDWFIDTVIVITGQSASGNSTNITTPITTALSTAGNGGVAVPLQVASATQPGVITSGNNTVAIFDTSTKKAIRDANGNEVYGRLTQATGTYTLTYYSNVAGTETAYNLPSSTIDFWFSYRFDIARLPSDFAIRYTVSNTNESIPVFGGANQKTFTELLTLTGTVNNGSVLPDLTKTPTAASTIHLYVNGIDYSQLLGHFTVSGKTITWTVASFSITTSDQVHVQYETTE